MDHVFYNSNTAALGSFMWLIITLGLGFVCKSMLENKGRSGGLGFILGFFFNVIGVIVCAVMPESSERMLARMQMMTPGFSPAPAVRCKNCSAALVPGTGYCPGCGAKI